MQGDTVFVITMGIFLDGKQDLDMTGRQLPPLTILEKIGANRNTLGLPYAVR
jgi:hypothetical protein